MNKFKQLFIGVIIGGLVFGGIPVFALTGTKTIEVIYNNIKITLDGKEVKTDAEPLQYQGRTFVPVRFVSEALGASVEWNNETKTVEIVKSTSTPKPIPTPTPTPKVSPAEITILGADFYNSGTKTLYTVVFSDHFIVSLGIPKSTLPSTIYETAIMGIYTDKMDITSKIETPNIIGFSELFDERYYPLTFSIYSLEIPSESREVFKEFDFYECFKSYKYGDNLIGMVVYDSFVKLEGISYDDGIHKCKLYFEDKNR